MQPQQLAHGVNVPGAPYRDGRTWFRRDVYTSTGSGDVSRERRFAAGPDDMSPPHPGWGAGYSADCASCWHGHSETAEHHAQAIAARRASDAEWAARKGAA